MSTVVLESEELRSHVSEEGILTLSIENINVTEPGADEVIIQVEAAPINPSDLGLMIGPADISKMEFVGTEKNPRVTMPLSPPAVHALKLRLGQSLPVGAEGAGTVIQAGKNVTAMIGKKVGIYGGTDGGLYTKYFKTHFHNCIPLGEDTDVAEGAALFVNPLMALAMVETVRLEGHTALIHTAAASNLGQMLVKICKADNIELVNIVRSEEQAEILRNLGAEHIVNSSADDFKESLTAAIAKTGATVAFEAVGGGKLSNYILHAMEAVARKSMVKYSRYGSDSLKQIYIYGGLDVGPTILDRGYGFSWSVSAFLLPIFLKKIGVEASLKLRKRIITELKSTFSSQYTDVLSLKDVLKLKNISSYTAKKTGQKYLINPTL